MKLKDLLKLSSYQFSKLSLRDQLNAVKYMEGVGNRRITKLEETGLDVSSSALHARNNRRFKTRLPQSAENAEAYHKGRKARLRERLKESFSSAQSFLESKSSTLKGSRKIYERAYAEFTSQNELFTASKRQQNKFWEAYNRLKDEKPDLFQSMNYMGRRQMLYDIMVKKTKTGKLRFMNVDDAVAKMNSLMESDYLRQALDQAEEGNPLNSPKTFKESID